MSHKTNLNIILQKKDKKINIIMLKHHILNIIKKNFDLCLENFRKYKKNLKKIKELIKIL